MKSVFFYAVTEFDLKFPHFFYYDHKILTALKKTRPKVKVVKLFFIFNSNEHEISTAHENFNEEKKRPKG